MRGNENLRRDERPWASRARIVAAAALAWAATAAYGAAPVAKPPPAQPTSAPTSQVAGTRWLGGSIGALSAFDVGQSLAVQVDYGVLRTPEGWRKLDLEWHLVVGLSAPSGETQLTTTVAPPFGSPVQVSAGEEKVSAYLLEIVPTARVLYNVTRGFAFFADGGLGLCQSFESYDRSEMYVGHSTRKEYATGFVVHAALGLAADVAPRWRVLFVPVAFSLQLGPKFSGFTPSLGVAYRL